MAGIDPLPLPGTQSAAAECWAVVGVMVDLVGLASGAGANFMRWVLAAVTRWSAPGEWVGDRGLVHCGWLHLPPWGQTALLPTHDVDKYTWSQLPLCRANKSARSVSFSITATATVTHDPADLCIVIVMDGWTSGNCLPKATPAPRVHGIGSEPLAAEVP